MRGYFGVGVYLPKVGENIGTLWRSAALYGAAFIFTIGKRYQKQPSDTMKTTRHIPLMNFSSYEEFVPCMPSGVPIICVELCEQAVCLPTFAHPQQAIYLLGAEDHGLPEEMLAGNQVVQIPTCLPYSLNVSVAGTLVMYDRYVKQGTQIVEPVGRVVVQG